MCPIVRGVKESTALGAEAVPAAALHGGCTELTSERSPWALQHIQGALRALMSWDLFILSYLGMFFQNILHGAGLLCDPV